MERRPDSAPDPRKRPNRTRLLLQVHIIWCPKFRRPVLVDGVDERLKELLSEGAAETRSEVVEMEVMPDHVHLLVEVDPRFGIRRSVKLARGRSSRSLRQEFPRLRSRIPTLWTNSYAVLTVGGAPLAVFKQFIEDQKRVGSLAKHRKVCRSRMRPTTAQGHALNRMAGARRWVWNWALRRWKGHHAAAGNSIPLAQLSSELTALKQQPETA